jgi:hypothetical protein
MFSDHQEGLGGVMFRVMISRALHYTTKDLLMITLNITPPRPSW